MINFRPASFTKTEKNENIKIAYLYVRLEFNLGPFCYQRIGQISSNILLGNDLFYLI